MRIDLCRAQLPAFGKEANRFCNEFRSFLNKCREITFNLFGFFLFR